MSESIITSPSMELHPEGDNNKSALLEQHVEGDAIAPTAPAATTSMTIQPAKHHLPLELSAGDQQTAWPGNADDSMKRARLDLVDRETASNRHASSPSIIMSSRHQSSLYPPSQTNKSRNTSTYPSLAENGLMIAPPHVPHPLQLPRFHQSWTPSPPAGQTGNHFGYHATPVPNAKYRDYNGEHDLLRDCTHLDPRLEYGAAVIGSIPTSPAESLPSCQTWQQNASAAIPDTQRHQSQPATPQGIFRSSFQEQNTLSVANTEVVTQVSPQADAIEKQTRHFTSTTGNTSMSLTLSKPAQAKDLDSFPWNERHLIATYARTEQGKKDVDFKQWHTGIRRPFWAHIMSSFGKGVSSSIYDRVLDKLCASHPCRRDPWTSHDLYRDLLGKRRMTSLLALQDWMYGTGTTTDATWRDTLSMKTSYCYRKVPWVQREKIIALSVILACADASSKEMRLKQTTTQTKQNIHSKFGILEKCRLTYLLSDQDHVVASEYWDGFAEELEKDPEQEHLYDKVVRAKQSTTPGNSMPWSSFPIHGQEAQEQGDQSHIGSPRQSRRSGRAGPGGIGDFQNLAEVEENMPQYSGNHEPYSLAQQYLFPAENTTQETEHAPTMITQETSLQDRVRQLEGENAELHRYIEWMHQQFPEHFFPPPQASSQHQP
ncbi:hypothetical protein LA080_010122 [Diaporthe eres]|nr:hypothetical protein LA080_010122 [Diaporthe eres]